MTDDSNTETPVTESPATAAGGGAAEALANDPVRRAAAQLELLGIEAREKVLSRMNPEIAQQIRDHMESQPDNRPHGQFSTDVATRRKMINDMANRVTARKTSALDQEIAAQAGVPVAAPAPIAVAGAPLPLPLPAPIPGQNPVAPGIAVGIGADPLEQLRTLHPAAIARAMQGERAEAWAIVLDRLDDSAKAALQLYLDGSARAAIEQARARQADLAASSPTLLATIVAAIGRTVVPRAMREHHQLLSSTPLSYTTGMGA